MLLEEIHSPSDIKKLSLQELTVLAAEMREEIIKTVARHGGHLASNLGVVELTLALHYVFDCPEDKLVFDVGHQCYAHKMLTGRFAALRDTLREEGGVSGFPRVSESECDAFTAGHASTAISAALGMARTRDVMGDDYHVVAVVGDGALTGGMCYEALNDAGQSGTRMIVILNENEMSISRNVGALSGYLTGLRQSRTYRAFKRGVRQGLERIPGVGAPMFRFVERFRDWLKTPFVDGKFFDALGFRYIGPVDGHDLKRLIRFFQRAREEKDPQILHVVTTKGKGYVPAESHPDAYHGVAPFLVETGEQRGDQHTACGRVAAAELAALAENDIRICAVTAAMPTGTGMEVFGKAHPRRFYDVGIAEEHAVTMAAGMAASGMKPYVAVYSTFLQRAFDQISTDVCINALPVTFLIDRAGLVGVDVARLRGNRRLVGPEQVRDGHRVGRRAAQGEEHLGLRAVRPLPDARRGGGAVRVLAVAGRRLAVCAQQRLHHLGAGPVLIVTAKADHLLSSLRCKKTPLHCTPAPRANQRPRPAKIAYIRPDFLIYWYHKIFLQGRTSHAEAHHPHRRRGLHKRL